MIDFKLAEKLTLDIEEWHQLRNKQNNLLIQDYTSANPNLGRSGFSVAVPEELKEERAKQNEKLLKMMKGLRNIRDELSHYLYAEKHLHNISISTILEDL